MPKYIVLHSKVSKDSASSLAEALGAKLEIPYDTDNRDFTKYDLVFKYGVSAKIKASKGTVINKSEKTKIAIDKLKTFNSLKEAGVTVEYTTDISVALDWIKEGHPIVARSTTKGSNGEGLTYVTNEQELYTTPSVMWTKLVDEAQELRIYLWRDKVLSIYVKTVSNDSFMFKLFKESEIYNHPQLVDLASKVYSCIGLDFCGLDVITDKQGKLNLLEVNSAPILFPYTLNRLVANIKSEVTK